MSKSLVQLRRISEPPETMFGKLMSISDKLMARYYVLLSRASARPTCIRWSEKATRIRNRRTLSLTRSGDCGAGGFQHEVSKRDLEHADLPQIIARRRPRHRLTVVSAYAQGFNLTKSRTTRGG